MILTEKAKKSKYIEGKTIFVKRTISQDFCQIQGGIYQFHENWLAAIFR